MIGDQVMIGANTTVLPGVVIGDRAVIGAGTVVNRDVPPGAFVAGNPIRVIPAGGGEAGERRWGKGAKRLGPVGSRWGIRPLFRRGAGPVLGRGPSGGPLRDIGGSPFNASSLQCSTPGRFAEGTFYDGKAPWFSHGLFWEATDCGESGGQRGYRLCLLPLGRACAGRRISA